MIQKTGRGVLPCRSFSILHLSHNIPFTTDKSAALSCFLFPMYESNTHQRIRSYENFFLSPAHIRSNSFNFSADTA